MIYLISTHCFERLDQLLLGGLIHTVLSHKVQKCIKRNQTRMARIHLCHDVGEIRLGLYEMEKNGNQIYHLDNPNTMTGEKQNTLV